MTPGFTQIPPPIPLPEGVDYFTVREIAANLRCAPMTVYRLVNSGKLPAVRLGKSLRIPSEAYFAWLHRGGTA